MDYDRDNMSSISQNVSEVKKKIQIEVFAITFLLLWWFGDLVIPLFYERSGMGSTYTMLTVAFPLLLNGAMWIYWGIISRLFGYSIKSDSRLRDPFERQEFDWHEFLKQKKVERIIDTLVALQAITMGLMLMYGLIFMRTTSF